MTRGIGTTKNKQEPAGIEGMEQVKKQQTVATVVAADG